MDKSVLNNIIEKLKFWKAYKGVPIIKPKPKDIEDKGFWAKGGFDIIFFILVCTLVAIGLVMMFSASYITAKSKYDDPFYFFVKQGKFVIAGIIAMIIISKINHNVFRRLAPLIFAVSVLLLILVLIKPAVIPGKEQFKRWLAIPGTTATFQPSEVAKFGLIIFLSWSFERHRKFIEASWITTVIYFALVGGCAFLVYLEDHLSGAVLILGIGLILCFLGGLNWKLYAFGAAIGLVAVILIIKEPEKILQDYMSGRIDNWLVKDYTDREGRWQTNQSLFALGSGGFFGLGLGNSKEKYLYLPEPQNDFVFAIVGEELGFVGCVFIILLFALLVWRGFAIALNARSTFGRLLTMGIVIQVGLQVILNIMVVTDVLPNTGISLPFFSFGGTSLLMLLGEMGIVLSVSRSSRINKTTKGVI